MLNLSSKTQAVIIYHSLVLCLDVYHKTTKLNYSNTQIANEYNLNEKMVVLIVMSMIELNNNFLKYQ